MNRFKYISFEGKTQQEIQQEIDELLTINSAPIIYTHEKYLIIQYWDDMSITTED